MLLKKEVLCVRNALIKVEQIKSQLIKPDLQLISVFLITPKLIALFVNNVKKMDFMLIIITFASTHTSPLVNFPILLTREIIFLTINAL